MIILETPRLVLRRLLPEDLAGLFALYRDPEIRRYFPEGTLSYGETKEELEWFLDGHPERPELGLWATIYKETGALIGRCGLLPCVIDGHAEVEVACLLDKAYWGRGLASEAARGIVRYAFDQLNLSRLICMIDPENQASINLAIRMGMAFEREAADEKGPFVIYAMARISA
jgi:ribosomal-protein-alanine N-acetyltransferase